MGIRREEDGIRLDPDKLRLWRRRKGWSQRELATAVQFSVECVSKLERAATTANKGTKLQTIFRFAAALDVPPEEIIERGEEQAALWSRGVKLPLEYLEEGMSDVTATRWQDAMGGTNISRRGQHRDGHNDNDAQLSRTPGDWLAEASEQGLLGHWMRAEYCALRAREFYVQGSEEWAGITLRHCALWREQAGDCVGARIYIDDVKKHYLDVNASPSPMVGALLYNRQAWLALEHYGDTDEAWKCLAESLRILHENGIDDRGLMQNGYSFRVRTLYERAAAQGHATLSARQMTPLADKLVHLLLKSLDEDWEVAHRLDPDNAHVHLQRLRIANFVAPGEAQQARARLGYLQRVPEISHHWELELGRLYYSNHDWDAAASAADRALDGFAEVAYPPGIALATTLRASATLRGGATSEQALYTCMDYWVMALILQRYPSHPV